MTSLKQQCQDAKIASRFLRTVSNETRNKVLQSFAQHLLDYEEEILKANQIDIQAATSLSDAMIDRLTLNHERIAAMAQGIQQVATLPDPIHQILEERTLSSGIHLQKISAPMGVIGIIFESRPNVSSDCTALCFKAGSACVLKGGKESYHSCAAIIKQMKAALREYQVDDHAVVLANQPTHEETQAFMEDASSVDLLIPRGGKKLIQTVVQHAKVPVIETGAGVCHTYVDEDADITMAKEIVINAKCSHPSVCNAMETLLVHENIAREFLPMICTELKKRNVIIHADESTRKIVSSLDSATNESWSTEYNDLEMNLRIVASVEEAVNHIETYGTHHSECIVSNNHQNVEYFMNGCDSACVYHNASTRFTDGFEFGLGAEIGISTQKLHARGPMGLHALTIYTYHLEGKGEIR